MTYFVLSTVEFKAQFSIINYRFHISEVKLLLIAGKAFNCTHFALIQCHWAIIEINLIAV